MRFRLRLVPALVMVMLLVGTVAAAPAGAQPPPPPPAVSCQVSYQVDAVWAGGFLATIVVTNTGGVPVTWQVTIVFPDGGIEITGG